MSTRSIVGNLFLRAALITLMAGACKTADSAEQFRILESELERAIAADEEELRVDNFQAFLKRHGENAVPLFEKLVTDAAETGRSDNAHQVRAAIDGLVLLKKERARGVLEKLASSEKAGSSLSQAALMGLVGLESENERVATLVAYLRKRREPQEQQSIVDELITLGRAEAAPHLKALRSEISDEDTLSYIDRAITMLADPSICTVYAETFRERSHRWSCVYRCAGEVRSRETWSNDACPKTIPNRAQ